MLVFLIGGYISSKLTPIRLVVGAWCLLTLVLLNVYNGVLTSYLMVTPYSLPLMDSTEDAAYDPNVRPVLVKNQAGDILFSVGTRMIEMNASR